MSEPALHFSHVTFGFGKRKPLFENLSCSLANDSATGKVIALMGPSGVGKTTFCDLALGIRQPQKGSIKFAPENANIAVIPQKGVIFDELSVRENIECLKYSKNMGGSFREAKVQHAVESLGLSHVLETGTHASAISGGEAQRVMLARIQTINCDVLILDEPCSFLDNRVKDSFLTAMRSTVDESRLLALMVTHVWDEARLVADEVLFFHQAQGDSVQLHHTSVTQAMNNPPTIDALFGIHWPDCAVVDRLRIAGMDNHLTNRIPQAAALLGFFEGEPSEREDDSLDASLLGQLGVSGMGGEWLRATLKKGSGGRPNVRCVFYGEDGVAIRQEMAAQITFRSRML